MRFSLLFVACLCLAFGSAFAADTTLAPEPKTTTTPEHKTTTLEHKTTTPEPKTTTPEPKTTTPEPKTTTPEPKTTTPEPKTTTPEPKTTTPEPKTTTAATTVAPITTPAPSVQPPMPPPPTEPYTVHNENVTCLVAAFAAQIAIEYNNVDDKNVTAYINVVNATVDKGIECSNNETLPIELLLHFGGENETKFRLRFVKGTQEDKEKKYVDQIEIEYRTTADVFPRHREPDANKTIIIKDLALFSVAPTKSYLCKSVDSASNSQGVTVTFDDVHLDAYRANNDTSFRADMTCQKDDEVNDLVPIAVGCALLALVVIVLIAYFIGRKRSRRLAYQSV